MTLTARRVAEILATHMASRDLAAIKPELFDQEATYQGENERGKALIRLFENHRRQLLEQVAEMDEEVRDAIK